MNNALLKWLYLAVLSLIWGSSFILIKKGLTGFGFVEAATIRVVSAGLVFMPIALMQLKHVPRRKIHLLVFSSLLGIGMPAYLFSISQQYVQSSAAGMLNALTPLFTFLVSIFLFRTRYKLLQVAGLFLGLLSSILLILSSSKAGFSVNTYALFIVLATFFYGLNINLIKNYLSDVPALSISSVTVAISGTLAAVFVLLPNLPDFVITPERQMPLLALLTLGVMGTAVAQFLQNKLIVISSALFASASTYVIPVVAIFWGVLDGEQLTFLHYLSIAGILLAIVLIRKDK